MKTSMRCPHDANELVISDSEGHTGRVCGVCYGTWLPFSYIDSIQHTRKFSAAEFIEQLKSITTKTTQLRCPSNCRGLDEAHVWGITLEWCPSCKGIWFDNGELKKLLASLPRRDGDLPPGYLAAEAGGGVLQIILMALAS